MKCFKYFDIFYYLLNLHTFQIDSTEEHIIRVLKSLKGPFSLIYYEKHTQNLYFSRDRLGRSTMLFMKSDHSIVISSVLGNYLYDETCTKINFKFIF